MTSDADDSMELDRLAFVTCLRCGGVGGDDENEESSKLLVCSEIGCPIVIHGKCVTSEPEIDGAGKYYCPYCAHKRALITAEMLRRKAMKAKEVLSKFISMSSRVSVVPGRVERMRRRIVYVIIGARIMLGLELTKEERRSGM